MTRRLSIGFLLLAGGVALYMLLVPRQVERGTPEPVPPARGPVADAVEGPDPRVTAMQAAFAELESERRDLSRQIGSLQVRLWGLELPAGQAGEVTEDMMAAQHLVKNPPMLGAFHDVAGVERERERVRAAIARLREIERQLPADERFSDPAPGR